MVTFPRWGWVMKDVNLVLREKELDIVRVRKVSDVSDKNAARMIVETPVDREYCSARQNIQAQLKQHGFRLNSRHGGELPQALAVDVVGMAFEDFEHDRGTTQVATLWELHPAIVNLHP